MRACATLASAEPAEVGACDPYPVASLAPAFFLEATMFVCLFVCFFSPPAVLFFLVFGFAVAFAKALLSVPFSQVSAARACHVAMWRGLVCNFWEFVVAAISPAG